LKWTFDAHGIVASSPSIAADGTIYVGSHDKNFYALAPDGKLKWKFATDGAIDAAPSIAADGTVYFSSTDGYLYALAPDGTQRWRLQTKSYTAATAVLDEEGKLYLAATKDYLFVSPEGKILFQQPTDVQMDMSAAVTANREVVYSVPWLRVGSFNRDHIWPLAWMFDMSFNVEATPNVDPQGNVYVNNGYFLVAIKPPNAAPPANSAWPLWRANAQQTGRAGK
jgi:outer membrane protein assembly factor BamB